MSRLVEVLYPLPDRYRTPLSIVRWWESRRLLYNKVVGGAGLITLAGLSVIAPPGMELLEPETVAVVGIYGVAANLCYSAGWCLEILARWVWGRKTPDMGPLLFREGLIFSVGLTLMPLVVTTLFQVLRVVIQLLT